MSIAKAEKLLPRQCTSRYSRNAYFMDKKTKNKEMRSLPSVDKILHHKEVSCLVEKHGRQLLTYAVRESVKKVRENIEKKRSVSDQSIEAIVRDVKSIIKSLVEPSLRPVINATGVVLHTNLGRAPLGERVLKDIAPIVRGYCNLEFDLARARRGHRVDHVAGLLKYLTGAEEVMVVNNNAAALILALHSFAKGKEVVISRGELIEIGGAFRIPEIMAAAGAKMVEVGTTNRTRLADYEKAMGPRTALIVKAHTSNFTITGFTEEVTVADLAGFAREKNIPFLYDIGSGLIRKPRNMATLDEPLVQTALACGVDMVTFSCDKLLGGPQAGVVAGKAALIKKLAKAPLMRALRVDKLSLAALESVCRAWIGEDTLAAANPTVRFLERPLAERRRLAKRLLEAFTSSGISAELVESEGQPGGGTLPGLKLRSAAVALLPPEPATGRQREKFAEQLFNALLRTETPVLGVLREGVLLFDCFALSDDDIPLIASGVAACRRANPDLV
jgi:L-seryl-tRNA(Ser) seleniumtransferase